MGTWKSLKFSINKRVGSTMSLLLRMADLVQIHCEWQTWFRMMWKKRDINLNFKIILSQKIVCHVVDNYIQVTKFEGSTQNC